MDKVTAERLAYSLMKQHLPQGWHFSWERTTHRAGVTSCTHRLITLNEYAVLQFSDYEVEQLILHEIAHGLTPGCRRNAGHDDAWLRAARRIGYEGGRYCRSFKAPQVFELSFKMILFLVCATIAVFQAFSDTVGLITGVVALVYLAFKIRRARTPGETLLKRV